MSLLEPAVRTPLLIVSLLAPGLLVLRACRLPRSLAAAFPLSMALIYFLSLTVALLGGKLSFALVGVILTVVSAAIGLVPARATPGPTTHTASSSPVGYIQIFIGLSVALFAWRAFAQPLSGPDTPFRWNFLALAIANSGDFSFYPPVTLTDFERYFYADGFAPFVAIQYWWTYAVLGTTLPHVTGLVVTGQFAATLFLAADIVTRNNHQVAGQLAAAVIASSGLVFWAYLLGQETGWISLSLVACFWCWTHASPDHPQLTALAAAAALLPALVAREYGPALLIAGTLLAVQIRARTSQLLVFALTGACLAAPWYLYVWIRCGNPFYSLSPLGLFPANETLTGLLESYRDRFAIPRLRPGILAYRLTDLVVNSPFAIAAIVVALASWRRHWAVLTAAGLLAGLWFSAAGYTSGGLHIANRALAPVFVLMVVVAASSFSGRSLPRALIRPALILGAVAAVWSLYVNAAPPAGPALLRPAVWWEKVSHVAPPPGPVTSRFPHGSLSSGARILSDNAYFHADEFAAGFPYRIIPFWAREVRFLFAADLTSAEAARQLRAMQIGAVQLQRENSPNWPHWSTFTFFRDIVATWPVIENAHGIEFRRVPDGN